VSSSHRSASVGPMDLSLKMTAVVPQDAAYWRRSYPSKTAAAAASAETEESKSDTIPESLSDQNRNIVTFRHILAESAYKMQESHSSAIRQDALDLTISS
jgi:hypothetical protein